jgi:hypothetical protein
LTDGEAMRLAAALRHLKALYGGWDVLASVMGVKADSLKNIHKGCARPGVDMARRAAKAAGKPLEAILGGLASADVCPTCGHRKDGP